MSEGLIMAQQHKAIKKLQAEVELLNEEWTKRDVLLQAALAERDALARIVEEAEHGRYCQYYDTWRMDKVAGQVFTGSCNCWKAKARAK